MDLRWLQDFLAVADTGNFTKAAEQRGSSQAAFSRRLQALEAWIGKPLIDRSFYPTRLTAEGEAFRAHAAEIVRALGDARAEVSSADAGPEASPGAARADHIRIAVPYALATTRLPVWWGDWTRSLRLTSSLMLGNIHDIGAALVAGTVDLAITFHAAQEPMFLDMARYDRVQIETDCLRPWAARSAVEAGRIRFPGTARSPVPLLRYTPGIYFARLVDAILDAAPAPLAATRVIDSDMADVLREMALAGHGIAWLPDSSLTGETRRHLIPVAGAGWTMDLGIRAYCDRSNSSVGLQRLWQVLKAAAGEAEAPPARRPAIPRKARQK